MSMKSFVFVILFIVTTIQARSYFEDIYDFMFGFKRTPYHTDTKPHSRPYQAYLILNRGAECSGVLISQNYVLTSADCVYGQKIIIIVLGAHNIAVLESTAIKIWTSSYQIHPKFNFTSKGLNYDIALIRLPEPVKISKYINPISIKANKSNYYFGKQAEITEYSPNVGDFQPKVIQKMDVIVITNKKCMELANVYISDYLLCTAPVEHERNSCINQPGTPLVYDNTLIGIATYGNFICDVGSPNIFVNIEAHELWIIENTDLRDKILL